MNDLKHKAVIPLKSFHKIATYNPPLLLANYSRCLTNHFVRSKPGVQTILVKIKDVAAINTWLDFDDTAQP